MNTNCSSFPQLLFAFLAFIALHTSVCAQTWHTNNVASGLWHTVASSANGSRLVAGIGIGGSTGPIYSSTNSGASWTQTTAPSLTWRGIASSADGSKLVAVSPGKPIYTSPDGGLTSSTNGQPTSQNLQSVASSADGTRLLAAAWSTTSLFVSTNSGGSWTPANVPLTNWMATCVSADGNLMIAGADYGPIYFSTDGGASWGPTTAPAEPWAAVTCSADGTKWAAAAFQSGVNGGVVYTSADAGGSWRSNNVANSNWSCLAASADGQTLILGASPGPLLTSTNAGLSWQQANVPTTNNWFSAACSADGAKRVAAAGLQGLIYSWQAPPRLTITASADAAVLSWPFSATEYLLETSPSTQPGTIWTPLTDGVTSSGQSFLLTNRPQATPAFYRLHKQ